MSNGVIGLGGLYRSCLVGDECQLLPGVMRSSGDLGYIDENGRLFYDGRCDRQVKRYGHRVNLDYIQQVARVLRLEIFIVSTSHKINHSKHVFYLIVMIIFIASEIVIHQPGTL